MLHLNFFCLLILLQYMIYGVLKIIQYLTDIICYISTRGCLRYVQPRCLRNIISYLLELAFLSPTRQPWQVLTTWHVLKLAFLPSRLKEGQGITLKMRWQVVKLTKAPCQRRYQASFNTTRLLVSKKVPWQVLTTCLLAFLSSTWCLGESKKPPYRCTFILMYLTFCQMQ